MKNIFESIITRTKNTSFSFDDRLDNRAFIELLLDKSIQLLRGLSIVFRGKFAKGLLLGTSVKIRSINKIEFGNWVSIGDYSFISGLGVDGLVLGNGVSIGSHCRIFTSVNYRNIGRYIRIGDNVGIGDYSSVAGSGGLTIGRGTIIGPYFSAHPENHVFDNLDDDIRSQGTVRAEIIIGQNCWIGAKVTILSGVTIGSGCVIGAGSVVTKDLSSNSIAVGVPAKLMRKR